MSATASEYCCGVAFGTSAIIDRRIGEEGDVELSECFEHGHPGLVGRRPIAVARTARQVVECYALLHVVGLQRLGQSIEGARLVIDEDLDQPIAVGLYPWRTDDAQFYEYPTNIGRLFFQRDVVARVTWLPLVVAWGFPSLQL
jgi:hypothetical protein